MIENIITIVAVLTVGIGFHLFWTYYRKDGYRELEKWADRQGYTILYSELRHFKTGPFFLSTRSRLQHVFYVTLEDKEGKQSKAWIKVGGVILGLLSNEIEVKWESSGCGTFLDILTSRII